MLFIVSAVGLVGAFVIGLDGLMLGSAGELERIVAIACFAFAAAGLVGLMVDDGWRAKKRRGLIGAGEAFQLVSAAPILAIMVGTFVATLLPAVYVMLPFFAIWGPAATERRAARAHPLLPGIPATPQGPLHVPAYT